MRLQRLLPLLLSLATIACAAADDDDGTNLRPPPDGGAFVRPDAAVEPGQGTDRLLFFIANDVAYASNAAGEGTRPLCPAARIQVDALGERVLCVPADDDEPLILYDVTNNRVLAEIDAWVDSANGPPTMSPSGDQVAVKATNENNRDIVRVYDDNGMAAAEFDAFEVLGWASADVLLVDGAEVKLWRVGGESKVIAGRNPTPIGPEPAGAVYNVLGVNFRVDFEGLEGAPRTLAVGQVQGVLGTQVVTRTIENEAFWVDAATPASGVALPLPRVPFDRTLGLRLARPGQVIVELQSLAACAGVQEPRASTSFRVDVTSNTLIEIADTAPRPHVVHIDGTGERAVVVDLDSCGVPAGTATLIIKGERESLGERSPGAITGAAVSVDGRFVAVGYADRVAVVDLTSDQVREAVAEGPARALQFR